MMSWTKSVATLLMGIAIVWLHCGCGECEDSRVAVDLDLSAVAQAASFSDYKESMKSLNGMAVTVTGRAVTMGEFRNGRSFLLVPSEAVDKSGSYRGEVPPYYQRIVVFLKEPWVQLPLRKRVRVTGTLRLEEPTDYVWAWASLRDAVAAELKD